MIARVIIDLSLDKGFDYNIPPHLTEQIKVGTQVVVPFGRSLRKGYVLNLLNEDQSDFPDRKDIDSIGGRHTYIPEPLVDLGRWMAEYYCCSSEQAIKTLLPNAVRSGRIKHHTVRFFSIPNFGEAEQYILEQAGKKRSATRVEIIKTLLLDKELNLELLQVKVPAATTAIVSAMVKAGLLAEERRISHRDPFGGSKILEDHPHQANSEQRAALERINEMMERATPPHTMLLYGITGSGKTEVYLQAIARAIEQGKEAIVLVPEISLTPQTVRRFRARFGNLVSVLHSGLTDGERFDEWSKINDGLVKIAVGARSAIFAPFRKLGLIVVDEEHDTSYKQDEAPRYHARDVAVMRGFMEKAVVILGSATPSLESYTNALNGKYVMAELKERAEDCVLPIMTVIDNRIGVRDEGKASLLSKPLVNAVYERLQRGEQTILFMNRRGYARQMMCDLCGFVAECSECSIAYTYHRHKNILACHMCGNVITAHDSCPKCASPEIRYSGVGTEKVEAAAHAIFKNARIARMDSDTMRKASDYDKILDRFRRGEIDILIGTQMIAKGLHFPNVTLVGILNADQGLFIPDFRSAERTFQLITQVAGRAGRGEIPGEVVVQSFNPEHDAIKFAVNNDFKNFYEYDMEVRKILLYPPAGHLIAVHFRGEELEIVAKCALQFHDELKPFVHDGMLLSEPSPSPIERIKGKYRWQIIIRGGRLKQIREHLRHLTLRGRFPKGIQAYIDVDAQSLS